MNRRIRKKKIDVTDRMLANALRLYATRPPVTRTRSRLRRASNSDGAVLVRPDGHIAWRSRGPVADPEATLANVLERVLGFASDDVVEPPKIGAELERRSA